MGFDFMVRGFRSAPRGVWVGLLASLVSLSGGDATNAINTKDSTMTSLFALESVESLSKAKIVEGVSLAAENVPSEGAQEAQRVLQALEDSSEAALLDASIGRSPVQSLNSAGEGGAIAPTDLPTATFTGANGGDLIAYNLPDQQGTQLLLNGVAHNARWQMWQQRLYVVDHDLVQRLGAELLDTAVAGQQPIRWFSDPDASPLMLPAALNAQARLLDITEWAQRAGWQVSANSGRLVVRTVSSQVTGVRQGVQSWGDRLVIDLTQPTPWQVEERGDQVTITLDAAVSPVAAQSFVPRTGTRLQRVAVTSQGDRTQLQLQIPPTQPYRITTLPAPHRLVIDIGSDLLPTQSIQWAPGILWQQRHMAVGAARFPVTLLELDLRQPGLSLRPIWSSPEGMPGTAPLIPTAERMQVIGAINAGFFNRNNLLPLGAIRHSGSWHSGSMLNRGAIAWDDQGNVQMGRLDLQGQILTEQGLTLPLFSMNSGYVGNDLAMYTPAWARVYTPIGEAETVITVMGDRIVNRRPGGTPGQTPHPIPTDGYLLVAQAGYGSLQHLPIDSVLQHRSTPLPSTFDAFPHVVGAGPLLLLNRQIVLNGEAEGFSQAFNQQAATRSVVGKLPDGRLLWVTLHSRVGARGPTLAETAQIMLQLGATDALNLDGGSSTSLYLGGRLLNRAPQSAARVHNAIGLFLQPPTSP